jgi:eukaryotic-like serine/threonine-protein kinase
VDLANGQPVGEPFTGYTRFVTSAAAGILGKRPVAATSGGDGTVRIWGLTTSEQIGPPLRLPLRIASVVIADGRLIIGFGQELTATRASQRP